MFEDDNRKNRIETVDMSHGGCGTSCWITETWSSVDEKRGQFPVDPVEIKGEQIHYVNSQTYNH